MEKQGVIAPGKTPPEDDSQKSASDLENHPTTRLAEHVADQDKKPADSR